LFKQNEKKNRKGTLTPKMPFAASLVLRDYRFQFNIKILSEGVIITTFLSKSLEFVQVLICEKITGVVFV